MCCFSIASAPASLFGLLRRRPKLHVTGTRIFARVADGTQWLAYSMTLATSSDVAMVLPLPVARRADDALSFIDLSATPDLFDRLDGLFLVSAPQSLGARKGGISLSLPKLVVHSVGSFEASYVPSLADMGRLDERFRIPDRVWHQRPDYASYGFAVFKLKKGAKKTIHPMAMRFETKEPRSIFFPTVHVHDGALHDTAAFDHALMYQAAGDPTRVVGPGGMDLVANRAYMPVVPAIPVALTHGVIDDQISLHRVGIRGSHPNTDVRVPV